MSLWLMFGLKYSSAVKANGFVEGHDIWVTIVCCKTNTHTLLWGYRSDIILERHFRCLDDKWTDSWQAPFTHSVVRPHVLFSDTQEGLQRCLAAWDKNATHSRSYYRRCAQSQGSVLHHSNSRRDKDTACLEKNLSGHWNNESSYSLQHASTNAHAHCVLLREKKTAYALKKNNFLIWIFVHK